MAGAAEHDLCHNTAMTEPVLALNEPLGERVERTTCYMCACRCGIKVHLKDGKIRYIEGNPRASGQQRRAVRQGFRRHHAALFPGTAEKAAEARRRTRRRRVRGNRLGRGAERWPPAWLAACREKDPSRLAFFTGRDQSQALTGWWAQQYGTPNFAAHGGFCSVNMAAGGPLYPRRQLLGVRRAGLGAHQVLHAVRRGRRPRLQPDQDRPRQAQEHAAPKSSSINPVRTGYNAIADEWIGIKPGTDGLLVWRTDPRAAARPNDRSGLSGALHQCAIGWSSTRPARADDGLFARDDDGKPLCLGHAQRTRRWPPTAPAYRRCRRRVTSLPMAGWRCRCSS